MTDTVLFPVSIGENANDIAMFLFGMCLPTFIVFYLFGEIHLYSKALVWSMLALGVCSAISMRLTRAQERQTARPTHGKRYSQPYRIWAHGINSHDSWAFCPATNRESAQRLADAQAFGGRHGLLWSVLYFGCVQPRRLVAAVLLLPIVVYLGLRRGSRLLAIGICVVLFFVISAAAAYLTRNGTDVKRLLVSAEAYSVSNISVYERQTWRGMRGTNICKTLSWAVPSLSGDHSPIPTIVW